MKHLLTLWEIMYSIDTIRLIALTHRMTTCMIAANSRPDDQPNDFTRKECLLFADELDYLGKSGAGRQIFQESVRQAALFRTDCVKPTLLNRALEIEVKHLWRALTRDLTEHGFFVIEPSMLRFVDNENRIGEDVATFFPAAKEDILHAGNCVAIGSYTAAVFHLMRVAEHGLRALARKVNVSLIDHRKPQPIEFATWDKVLIAIRNQIRNAHASAKNAARERKLQFYSDLASNCEYLRDLWRNEVSHSRKSYNMPEAIGVELRVREFMQRLAKGLK